MICSPLNLLFFTLRFPSATSLLRKISLEWLSSVGQGHTLIVLELNPSPAY